MYNDFSSQVAVPNKTQPSRAESVFHDGAYLRAVVSHLRHSRINQSVKLSKLAASRHLDENLLEHAEKGNLIPNVKQLKAWAKGLGLSWEQLWTDALPRNGMQRQPEGARS